jgi:dGTPase
MIRDLIENSWHSPRIALSKGLGEVTENLRKFLFANVYVGSAAKGEEQRAKFIVKTLYQHYLEKPAALPPEIRQQAARHGLERAVCDYISGMTDRYIIIVFEKHFIPKPWGN